MSLPIITAEQRLAERSGVKMVVLGKAGIGKTSLLKTLPEASTLFVDLEAGDLAVKDWHGDCIRPVHGRSFEIWWCSWLDPTQRCPIRHRFLKRTTNTPVSALATLARLLSTTPTLSTASRCLGACA